MIYLNLVYLENLGLLWLTRAIGWNINVCTWLNFVEFRGELFHACLEYVLFWSVDQRIVCDWIERIYLLLNQVLLQ